MVKKLKSFTDESVNAFDEWLQDSQMVELPKPHGEDLAEELALKKLLDEYSAAISKGYHLVMSEVASDPEQRNHINDFRIDIDIIKQMRNTADASRLLKQHGVLQGVLGISGETMGEMYRIAHNLYSQKKYEQASWVLQYMLFLNPYVCWLWQELARCCQELELWDESLWAYGVALNCDPSEAEIYRSAVKASLENKSYSKAREFLQFGLNHICKPEVRLVLEGLLKEVEQKEHGHEPGHTT